MKLQFLDLENFDTSNVTNMDEIFGGCIKLIGISGINNFKTNKVTTMKQMFQECQELEYLDLSNFDTSNVVDMRVMFYNCNKLKELNLLNFYVNQITEKMFSFNKEQCILISKNQSLKNLFKS